MIRIVTRSRLAALEWAVESAQNRVDEVQGAADAAASCHTRSVQRLSTALATARAAADGHQADAEIVRDLLKRAEAELVDTQATVAEQAEQTKALQGELDRITGAVVLLNYGRLVSIHPTNEAARRHAESLGCPGDGWRPGSGGPASEVAWRISALSTFAVQDGGGAG
ncbi:hypothetical protein CG747_26045 [Streptomyces sp. CB02959]|uniref:hypothetical protein n=1 Tax=Streptomyces sp. CB02959 TaxID=2020330 RepID=UPI000C275F1D|nr:hypothetical protein [Streptomyces sp. CB02959]PJN37953.1 hypothetical protein CG747_26045 [Streptomyces sp. CB02959]